MLYSLGSPSCELLFVSIPVSVASIEILLEEFLGSAVNSVTCTLNVHHIYVVFNFQFLPVIDFFPPLLTTNGKHDI